MIPDNQTLSSLNHKNPNGTVSVEVSSISADKAILTVKDFSFDNYEDLSIIIKETEFSEPVTLDFPYLILTDSEPFFFKISF